MKKTLSILLSILMLMSITAGLDFSAYADEYNSKTLQLGGSWTTDNISKDASAYYKFTLPSDGIITMNIMHYLSVNIHIYDESFSDLLASVGGSGGTSGSPVTTGFNYTLSTGTYYVVVEPLFPNDSGIAKAKVQFESFNTTETEPNDFDNPNLLKEGKEIVGCFTKQDDDDWYIINVPVSCELKISYAMYDSNMKIEVLNYDLSESLHYQEYYKGTPTAPEFATITVKAAKGTYYIHTSDYYTGKYKLSYKLNIPVAKPASFKVTSRSTASLKLSWSKVSPANGYQLQCYKNGNWTNIATTTSTSYTVKSLKSGTAYKFRVRAYRAVNGKKYYGSYVTLSSATKPSKVTINSLKANGKKQFTVKMKKISCTGYQIQYSTSSNFKSKNTTTTTSTSKTVKKLKSKKKYFVRVRAYKTVNGTKYYGDWSAVKSIKTK